MKKRIWILAMILVAAFGTLTACSQSDKKDTAQKIDGLEKLGSIGVITREEGSGTRSVFAQKTNLENEEDDTRADKITKDAKVAMNAQAVMDEVAKDENAIGYVSLGAMKEKKKGIKVLAIDGVKATSDTIQDDSYPLSRSFHLAYGGKLSDVETDFFNYILTQGQKVVAKDYTSVKKSSKFLSTKAKGMIKISGSSSASDLVKELAKEYQKNYNENATVEVTTSDTTSGLTAALQGSIDWGMASRDLKDYEKELLEFKTIAKDGVAIIVNEKNPAESLTVDQLTQIFDGTDQTWEEVNE